MPDITYLPVLAEYFKVSTDQLMGIVPLSGEDYIAQETGTGEFWENKMEYLLRTRKRYWNHDYVRFLIEQVWKIDKPVQVLDCGCGFGFLGMLMMPFLPKGSTYTGIDLAGKLLELGEKLFSETDYEACFIHKDVYDYHAKERYDMVICQAVLRHLDAPDVFLGKMIQFAKKGAWVICIDSNREFECDGLYFDGMDYFDLCRHDGMEKHWKTELAAEYCDRNIEIADFFRTHPDVEYTFVKGTMISYGKK